MTYTQSSPFLASLKSRHRLNKSGSKKDTQHLILSIENSDISYEVGDSVGILPCNDPHVVKKTIQALKASGAERIRTRQETEISLQEFLSRHANISDVTKNLIKDSIEIQTDSNKKKFLESLLIKENREELKTFIQNCELWDFLEEFNTFPLPPQNVCNHLRALIPRLYSIASSMKHVGKEIHLTVAKVEYETNGQKRNGVATNYLCNTVPLNIPSIPIYIQPSHSFKLADPQAPIIMIGPGTGIAPFRAFMQERIATKAKGESWLFFGEWNRKYDFFYEEFWKEVQQSHKLRLDLAFSRDQNQKVYVQHKLLENADELWDWLEMGAYLYICGDAKKMAKDVDLALHQIIEDAGNKSSEEAKQYIKQLKKEKRYQKDVY